MTSKLVRQSDNQGLRKYISRSLEQLFNFKMSITCICLYRSPRSKCSLCCSVPGWGTPVLSWLGGGVPSLRQGVPLSWDTPHLGLGYPWERTWDQRPGKEPGTGVPPRILHYHYHMNHVWGLG